MSSYDFILDGIRFSYSSVSTFDNCAYSYKLSYIDAMPRINNFYAEYGTLVHQCFEQFFTKKLSAFELSDYYKNNYEEVVKTPAPVPPYGLDERYRAQGQEFFDNFNFPIDDYDVILVEDKIDFSLTENIEFVAKPDLVLREKATQKTTLFDYKTSSPFREDKKTGREIVDNAKLNGYWKQMNIYAYALRNHKFTPIDEITLWFPRSKRMETIQWSYNSEQDTIKWLTDTLGKLKTEEVFPYNNSSQYFCDNLCSVRNFCEYH